MRESDFARWLVNGYVTRHGMPLKAVTRQGAIARCRRIERHEGDLDEHYDRNWMNALLDRFTYSKADEAAGHLPAHSVPMAGNVLQETYCLKAALVLYRLFRRAEDGTRENWRQRR